MSDLHYISRTARASREVPASEDKMYVRRYAANHNQIAEEGRRSATPAGLKTIG